MRMMQARDMDAPTRPSIDLLTAGGAESDSTVASDKSLGNPQSSNGG
jgi:hypothetical protein